VGSAERTMKSGSSPAFSSAFFSFHEFGVGGAGSEARMPGTEIFPEAASQPAGPPSGSSRGDAGRVRDGFSLNVIVGPKARRRRILNGIQA